MNGVKLTEFELRMCAAVLGYERLEGFDEDDREIIEPDVEITRQRLIEKHIVEKKDDDYQLTALSQFMIRLMGEADAWLGVWNKEQDLTRRIYVKGADYLCVDEKENELTFLLLPILPFAIGAYADALEASSVYVKGRSGKRGL